MDPTSQSYAIFFGLAGATSSLVLSGTGAAIGTLLSASGMSQVSSIKPYSRSLQNENTEMTSILNKSDVNSPTRMKNLFPVVISGVLAIYGLIFAIICSAGVTASSYSTSQGYAAFTGGITVGMCCLVAGIAAGIVGKSGIIACGDNSKMFVPMVLNLIYCEALGLYGLIFGLITSSLAF